MQATTVVDSLDEVFTNVDREVGETLDGPNEVPTGRNLTIRHPGAIIEYIEIDTAKV